MIETVFLLPGQGCYRPGALIQDASAETAEACAVVDRVAAEFGRAPISPLLRAHDTPTAVELARSDPFALQLAIFTIGVCGYRAALRGYRPDVVVGHSMGEFAALVGAGVFDIADGARLVSHRSLALLEHCPQPGGMVAVGLNARRAEALVTLVDIAGSAVAVRNAPQQTVVAGPEIGMQRIRALAESLGVTATTLPAPYAYHSPMLGAAVAAFSTAAASIFRHPLRTRVYSPAAGDFLDDRVDAKAVLAEQLTRSVGFMDAVRRLHCEGARMFVECGRAGLAELVLRTVPDVQTAQATATEARSTAAAAPVEHTAVTYLRPASPTVYGTEPSSAKWTPPSYGSSSMPRPTLATATQQPSLTPVSAVEPVAAQTTIIRPAISEPVVPSRVEPVTERPATPVPTDIATELRELYASALGYPVEAVSLDADLEADLGIDSLKRAEMLGRVRAHFGLADSGDDGRFLAQSTLGELAELVAAAR